MYLESRAHFTILEYFVSLEFPDSCHAMCNKMYQPIHYNLDYDGKNVSNNESGSNTHISRDISGH